VAGRDDAALKREPARAVQTPGSRSRRATSGKPQRAADPHLVAKLPSGGRSLVPLGPPDSPREGIVQQSFTGSREIRGGPAVSRDGGPGTGDEEEGESGAAGDTTEGECGDCGAPSVKSTVADLATQPMMRAAFDKPCGGESLLINAGLGERFSISGSPACVVYIPQTCRGSGVAIFEDRFVVSVHGECIPNMEFLKEFLQR
jgi:hypothetical protein